MVYSFATVAPEENSGSLTGGCLVSLLRGFVLAAISLSLVFVLSKPVLAQDATGRVIGTVYDQQGGVVPAAKVTVTNTGTQVSRSTVTDKDGHFEALDLPIGDYRVAVEHDGFNRTVTQDQKPVSYTHLDVYKRQVERTSSTGVTMSHTCIQYKSI